MATKKQKDETFIAYTEEEIKAIQECGLTDYQMGFINKPTPEDQIFDKVVNGRTLKYVKGSYVVKVLNLMFGFEWNDRVLSQAVTEDGKQAIVVVRLRVIGKGGKKIKKEQFGASEVENGNLGDAYKAAATDGLKKCASKLGIAADVYGSDDISKGKKLTNDEKLEKIKELIQIADKKAVKIAHSDKLHLERVVSEKEVSSYDKVIAELSKKVGIKE